MIKNSSLGAFCGDLANFECSQTISLVSHSKFAKNTTTSTANTRICLESNSSSLRGALSATKQSTSQKIDCFGDELPRNDDRVNCYEIPRHTERSEVSKSCDFNQTKDAMIQNSELYTFAQSKQVANDSKVAKMDSSRCRAQNDESSVKSRNNSIYSQITRKSTIFKANLI